MAYYFAFYTQIMKRLSSDRLSSDSCNAKRRSVSLATYHKWKTEIDQECSTLSWLDCETSGAGPRKTVVKLRCKVCIKYQLSIESRRNYSDKWILGADSIRNSNIRDHARSDQHAHAMLGSKVLLKNTPWLYWSWCLAHRVELAVKDALKGTSFEFIDDMLLRLYYIYGASKNRPKSVGNWRKLLRILSSLLNSMMQGLNHLEHVAHAGYPTSYQL